MLSVAVYAQKAPKGQLLSYSHTITNPEIPLYDEFSVRWADGKGIVTIRHSSATNRSEYTGEVGEDVRRQVDDIIKAKRLYSADEKKEEEDPKYIPYANPGRDRISIHFEDGSVSIDCMDLTTEQQDAFEAIETILKTQSKEAQSK